MYTLLQINTLISIVIKIHIDLLISWASIQLQGCKCLEVAISKKKIKIIKKLK